MKKELSFKVYISVCGITFLIFFLAALLFPYSGDDWAWGSYIGIERLQTFFENYNGRYLGNFLVLLLTRSKVLCAFSMAVSYTAICFICSQYAFAKKNLSFIFALILFFFMPKDLFSQTVVWTSGFSNYVPSAIISALFILFVKNITGKDKPEYNKYLFILTFFMGLTGALFIENVTLFNICLGIAVILYTALKFRKAYLSHFSFLIGSIAGALIMFSNSAYSSIASGDDPYRESMLGSARFSLVVNHHITGIFSYLFSNNLFFILIITLLLATLVYKFLKNSKSRKMSVLSAALISINIGCFFLIFCSKISQFYTNPFLNFNFLEKDMGHNIVCALYLLSCVFIVLLTVEKHSRFRILLPLYCVPIVCIPLIIVNPLGERCVFVAYLFMMMFAAGIFSYLVKNVSEKEFGIKALFCSLAAAAVIQTVIIGATFINICNADIKRNEFAKKQAEDGNTTIIVSRLPSAALVWCSDPSMEPWGTRYKLFHNIPMECELVCVNFWELDYYINSYSD